MLKFVAALYTLYSILFTPHAVLATESALSASPAILESIVQPNTTNLTTITIQNNTNFPLPLKGSVSAFLSTEDIPDSAKETFNASSWFTLEPADLILQPSEVKQIKVTITPPKDAEPGGHYATIYFRPLIPQEAVTQSSAISLARIGVLAFLIVPGNITEAISTPTLFSSSFQAFGPVKFTSHLENQGSVHLLPITKLEIKDMWGNTIATLTHPTTAILPHTTKQFNYSWDTKLGFGRYSAILSTQYGTDNPSKQSDPIFFWLIPWPLIILIITILTFIYKIFIVNRRRLVLALQVLKGNYDQTQINQKNPSQHTRSNRRPNSPHPSALRRSRRQLDG